MAKRREATMRKFMRIVRNVSPFIAVVGIAVSVFLFVKSKKVKALTATVEASASVVEIREPVPELTILYKSEEIKELYVLVLEIKNTGNLDIRPEDFVGPLHFKTGARVVDAKITETHPEDFGIALEAVGPDKVVLTKCLFKAGEWLTVKTTLLSAPQLDFSANRITDLKQITLVEDPYGRALSLRYSMMLLIVPIFTIIVVLLSNRWLLRNSRKKLRRELLIEFSHLDLLNEDSMKELAQEYGLDHLEAMYTVNCIIKNVGREPIYPQDYTESLKLRSSGRFVKAVQIKAYFTVAVPIPMPSVLDLGRRKLEVPESLHFILWIADSPNVEATVGLGPRSFYTVTGPNIPERLG